jgi:hypothetical protein
VKLHALTLGPEDGTASFTVGQDTTNKVVVGATGSGLTQVRMARLDTVLNGANPALIKMDVEGFEMQVLSGAAQTLASPALIAILTESDEPQVVDVLSCHGFSRHSYDPLTRRLTPGGRLMGPGNALFLRNLPEVERRLRSSPPFTVLGQTM